MDDQFRFQFRFDGLRDVSMDGSFVDELLTREGSCSAIVPFLDMTNAAQAQFPEVDFEGPAIDVFLVRAWGGVCEAETLGFEETDRVVLNIGLITSWTGGAHGDTHHFALAHELGHAVGLEHFADPGNLMNDFADAIGTELTEGQCDDMAHDSL